MSIHEKDADNDEDRGQQQPIGGATAVPGASSRPRGWRLSPWEADERVGLLPGAALVDLRG